MNKFTNDNDALKLQAVAFDAAKVEADCLNDYLDGVVDEAFYTEAMNNLDASCKAAINAGVSIKDLPAF